MLPLLWKGLDYPLLSHRSAMDRLFENFWGGRLKAWNEGDGETFLPTMDVKETEKAFVVEVELPGMKASEVEVKFEEGMLTLSGERKREKEEKGENIHRSERHYGRFVRSVSLPASANGEKVEAVHQDGVLVVTIPKRVGATSQAIPVKEK